MSIKIKKPVTKGVAKVPVVMQLEALECGAACLTMIMAYYRKWVPLEQVRVDCGVSRNGSNAKNILRAARYYGFKAQGYRFEPESLKEYGSFPCIIHWEFNHFIVLDGFRGGRAYLNDPAKGAYSVPMSVFDEGFTGICLMMEPDEQFVPDGKPKSVLKFAAKRLKGTGPAVVFTILTIAISSLLNIIHPVFSRIFLDRLLSGMNREWLVPFIVFLAIFDFVQIIVSVLSNIYSLRMNGKVSVVGSTSYMWAVLKKPMSFFSQRMTGDIQSRQNSNASISNTLINIVSPILMDSFMLVFYLVIMLRYNTVLTVVGLSSLALNAAVSNYIAAKRVNITRVSMRESSKLASASVAGIEMIETIKASGAEQGYFAKWSGHQANVNSLSVRFMKINQYLGMIPGFVDSLASDLVLILGVFLTMQGEFTVGMIMAFQGFLQSFMAPASKFVSAGTTIQEMRTSMERVEDVMEYPEDNIFAPENDMQNDLRKLTGNVEIRDLVFGYSNLDEPLISDFCLSLQPGKSVALVGASGCGKSTISKLISGLYQPWSGSITFDGKSMKDIPSDVFRASVAVVDQDIILFEDTIANNIKMWDESIEDFEMILAARDAQLHDDIMDRPGGYQYKILENGKDFSGGQKQRLEIARVLAQDPTLIIMDEATSALDAQTEYDVVQAIRDRGITCIVVAHRLSTIRSCDEIILLDDGHIVDRGTHTQLFNRCETYRNLVSAE